MSVNTDAQCWKCVLLGCSRGPGFDDIADLPPSMWRCPCRCHPINRSNAAELLAQHVGANHGRVTSHLADPETGVTRMECECGEAWDFNPAEVGEASA